MKLLIVISLLVLLATGCGGKHVRKNCQHQGQKDNGDQLFECEDL